VESWGQDRSCTVCNWHQIPGHSTARLICMLVSPAGGGGSTRSITVSQDCRSYECLAAS
jgi:hypothetical protein